jgi:translation initiation factor 2B subunit (eIF-2B alpha/beta/delta family)
MRRDVKASIENIRNDKRQGADALAIEAMRTLGLAAGSSDELLEAARTLVGSRPSMTAIDNAVLDMVELLTELPDGIDLRIEAAGYITRAIAETEESQRHLAEQALDVISPGQVIFTLTYSNTVFSILVRCRPKRVIVAESRPRREGAELAWLLAQEAMPVTLITDAEAGHFLPSCDLVLVGADSIGPDGSIVNKMGTYLVALAAKSLAIPFYSAGRTQKIRPSEEIELERMSPSEVATPMAGVDIHNIYFDLTPADLITSIITEAGVFGPEQIFELRTDRSRIRRKLQAAEPAASERG